MTMTGFQSSLSLLKLLFRYDFDSLNKLLVGLVVNMAWCKCWVLQVVFCTSVFHTRARLGPQW